MKEAVFENTIVQEVNETTGLTTRLVTPVRRRRISRKARRAGAPVALPEFYGVSYAALMDVGPRCVYVHWELNSADLHQAVAKFEGDGRLVIRVYDVTSIYFDGANANCHFDVPVEEQAHGWYIDLWESGKSLIADIGMKGPHGEFVSLARSNCIHTPREAGSGGEPEWLHVDGHSARRTHVRNEDVVVASVNSNPVELRIEGKTPDQVMWEVSPFDVVTFYQKLWSGAAGAT
jgi:uncharacterized protein